MKHQFAVLAIILFITGCKDDRPAHTQRAEDSGKNEITTGFFDPASVQFRNLKTRIVFSSYAVCGELNAKNRYGAYTGFKRFSAILSATSDLKYQGGAVEGDASFDRTWSTYCQ